MSVLIAINGLPNERSLISVRKQKCDLVVIDNKDLFFKSALKYAEKYDFCILWTTTLFYLKTV